MHIQRLIYLLQQDALYQEQDIIEVKACMTEYPYFFGLHMILARGAYAKAHDLDDSTVREAALYAADPNYFYHIIQNGSTENIRRNKRDYAVEEGQENYLNNYIADISHREPKSCKNAKSIEQFQRIDKILNDHFDFDFASAVTMQPTNLVDLASGQSALNYDHVTETLAKTMVKQQQYQQAKKIYEALILKYPEKKIYFTERINSIPQKS